MNPRAPNLHEHKTQKNMDLRAQDVFPRTDKKCEHKAPKILRAEGESRSMFCESIWGGGAAPSPPTPLQLFFFLGLPPLQGQPTPTWNVSTSNWNHRKKIIPKINPHPLEGAHCRLHPPPTSTWPLPPTRQHLPWTNTALYRLVPAALPDPYLPPPSGLARVVRGCVVTRDGC